MVGNPDATHDAVLATCKEKCDAEVHDHCLQFEETRHLTLWKGRLTETEAESICFDDATTTGLPCEVALNHLKNWSTCLAFGPDDATATRVMSIAKNVKLPKGVIVESEKKFNNGLHLSLYRAFGNAGLKAQIPSMKYALKDSISLGTVSGHSVVVKVVGSDYDTMRIVE